MVLQGHVHDGSIILDEGAPALPEGARVRVELIGPAHAPSSADTDIDVQAAGSALPRFAGRARGLPPDASRNHEHYIYGTPREEDEPR